jgi:hypothetical protein
MLGRALIVLLFRLLWGYKVVPSISQVEVQAQPVQVEIIAQINYDDPFNTLKQHLC